MKLHVVVFTVSLSSPLDKWDDVNLDVEDGGDTRREQSPVHTTATVKVF